MVRGMCLALALSLCGCSHFQTSGDWRTQADAVISRIHSTAINLRVTTFPLIEEKCVSEAQSCAEAGAESVEQCPRFVKCVNVMNGAGLTLKAIHYAIRDAQVAVATSGEKDSDKAIDSAMGLLSELIGQLRDLGVL